MIGYLKYDWILLSSFLIVVVGAFLPGNPIAIIITLLIIIVTILIRSISYYKQKSKEGINKLKGEMESLENFSPSIKNRIAKIKKAAKENAKKQTMKAIEEGEEEGVIIAIKEYLEKNQGKDQ